jgi:hypothetical protein
MNIGQKILYEIDDRMRREAALTLWRTTPCIQVFSMIAFLADEIGMKREDLLLHFMNTGDKLEKSE